MFKLDLETAEEPEIKLPTSAGSSNSIKDRNGMDLTEVEDLKKRRQENIEEL